MVNYLPDKQGVQISAKGVGIFFGRYFSTVCELILSKEHFSPVRNFVQPNEHLVRSIVTMQQS